LGTLALGNNLAGDYTLTGASGSVRINPAPGSFAISTTMNNAATFAASKVVHYASDAGVTLSIPAVASPSVHGTVGISGNNITYTPTTSYTGSDIFTYTLSDNVGGSSTGTVNVTVSAANVSPSLSIANVGGYATLTTSGLPSQQYDIQYSDNLGSTWSTTSDSPITSTANGVVYYQDQDPISNHTSRMYRLKQH
jgi:hypothetical protein